MSGENRTNFIAGLALLALGVLTVTVLIPFGIDEPGGLKVAALSPSYWPRIVAVALALAGAGIAASALLAARASAEDEPEDFALGGSQQRTPWRALAALVLLFVLYACLEPLGFVLTGAVALAVYMLLAGENRPLVIAAVALGVPLALYLFFTKAAGIPIPAGILEPILVG